MSLASVGFGVVGACLLASALLAATSRRLVHSVLFLALALLATAVLYVTLAAPFLAAVQVLLYAGGVITLMLFGIMLTDERHEVRRGNPSHRRIAGALAAGAVFGILATATARTPLPGPPDAGIVPVDTVAIGKAFLGPHLLAFEVLSLLLLAAMLGAIVLARRSDP